MNPASSAREARTFLKKAVQYLESALDDVAADRFNPAVSNAVVAGINACDVICIAGTGSYNTAADHSAVYGLLERTGDLGTEALPLLQVLMPQKNLAQYRSVLISKEEAERAVDAAERLVDLAREAAARLPG